MRWEVKRKKKKKTIGENEEKKMGIKPKFLLNETTIELKERKWNEILFRIFIRWSWRNMNLWKI